ncbi:hypothetical protein SEA_SPARKLEGODDESS_11 [Streptomyces phage SparkleGoddess]|uniref:Uncharacterized protein n=1 Tax=Streptomyces phage SparkleGoddess TaxID=2283305 RepID=A0A345MDU8_9CAUD|nr:hypothetical protein SEA_SPARKLEGODDESS_11 [Streptomyces phage SparkleGoddess]QZE11611.1 hypothetical protein SEA_KARP_11 [Streptomyces phage Karp]
MANIFIGRDGVPIEQSDDGAFHVTEKKIERAKTDLKKFKEIVNGPDDAKGNPANSAD